MKCLPYQPLDKLSGSLSAADLHVVVMGNEFVGIVHPCKVYNIISIGGPTLYVGPTPSHVTDIASLHHGRFFLATHNDVDSVTAAIIEAMQGHDRQPVDSFAKHVLLPQLMDVIELRQDSQDVPGLIKIRPAARV